MRSVLDGFLLVYEKAERAHADVQRVIDAKRAELITLNPSSPRRAEAERWLETYTRRCGAASKLGDHRLHGCACDPGTGRHRRGNEAQRAHGCSLDPGTRRCNGGGDQ